MCFLSRRVKFFFVAKVIASDIHHMEDVYVLSTNSVLWHSWSLTFVWERFFWGAAKKARFLRQEFEKIGTTHTEPHWKKQAEGRRIIRVLSQTFDARRLICLCYCHSFSSNYFQQRMLCSTFFSFVAREDGASGLFFGKVVRHDHNTVTFSRLYEDDDLPLEHSTNLKGLRGFVHHPDKVVTILRENVVQPICVFEISTFINPQCRFIYRQGYDMVFYIVHEFDEATQALVPIVTGSVLIFYAYFLCVYILPSFRNKISQNLTSGLPLEMERRLML